MKTSIIAKLASSKYIFLLMICLLSGCGGDDPITEIGDPELVAVAFFDALYNQRDVEKAASVCSPQMARILLHYHLPNAIARNVFNMSFDHVNIKPDDSGVKVREQFKNKAIVILYFDGTYHGEKMKDVKRVSMIQLDGKWVMDKLLKDPF